MCEWVQWCYDSLHSNLPFIKKVKVFVKCIFFNVTDTCQLDPIIFEMKMQTHSNVLRLNSFHFVIIYRTVVLNLKNKCIQYGIMFDCHFVIYGSLFWDLHFPSKCFYLIQCSKMEIKEKKISLISIQSYKKNMINQIQSLCIIKNIFPVQSYPKIS